MMFLEEADFRKQIRDDTLERIIGDDASILYDAERATLAEMESYLRVRFDVAQIWNKIGTARNALIVMYAVDILLYHIHSRIAPQQIPALRGIRYDSAIAWLKASAKGEISPDLPRIEAEGTPISAGIIIKSQPKQNFDF